MSDTQAVLMKSNSARITIFAHNSFKKSFFPGDVEGAKIHGTFASHG